MGHHDINHDCGPECPQHSVLHHSCINPSACLVCMGRGPTPPTVFTMDDLINALKPKHTIAVSTEDAAERLRAALDEAGLRAEVIVSSVVDEDKAILMRNDLLTVPLAVEIEGLVSRWVCESPGLMPYTEDGNIRYSLRHSKCGLR